MNSVVVGMNYVPVAHVNCCSIAYLYYLCICKCSVETVWERPPTKEVQTEYSKGDIRDTWVRETGLLLHLHHLVVWHYRTRQVDVSCCQLYRIRCPIHQVSYLWVCRVLGPDKWITNYNIKKEQKPTVGHSLTLPTTTDDAAVRPKITHQQATATYLWVPCCQLYRIRCPIHQVSYLWVFVLGTWLILALIQ
jgi:hypothetical protein